MQTHTYIYSRSPPNRHDVWQARFETYTTCCDTNETTLSSSCELRAVYMAITTNGRRIYWAPNPPAPFVESCQYAHVKDDDGFLVFTGTLLDHRLFSARFQISTIVSPRFGPIIDSASRKVAINQTRAVRRRQRALYIGNGYAHEHI